MLLRTFLRFHNWLLSFGFLNYIYTYDNRKGNILPLHFLLDFGEEVDRFDGGQGVDVEAVEFVEDRLVFLDKKQLFIVGGFVFGQVFAGGFFGEGVFEVFQYFVAASQDGLVAKYQFKKACNFLVASIHYLYSSVGVR